MRLTPILLVAALVCLAATPMASAHASKNSADGKVRVTWGWQTEPAFVGEKLRLELILRDAATGAGIGGVSAADIRELSLHLGDEAYDFGNLTAYSGAKNGVFAGPGNYTAANAVVPTQEGIYTLHIKGTIAGSEVDLEIPATHALESMDELEFPGHDANAPGDLESRLAALEQEVATLKANAQTQSETPAAVTSQTNDVPAVGVASVLGLLGVAALVIARRR